MGGFNNMQLNFDCLKGFGKEKKKEKVWKKKKKQKQNRMTKEGYREYLKSTHWKVRRKIYWDTYKRICFCCKQTATEIHHCSYKRLGRERNGDLVPLCHSCHKIITEWVKERRATLKDAHYILEKQKNGDETKEIIRKEPEIIPSKEKEKKKKSKMTEGSLCRRCEIGILYVQEKKITGKTMEMAKKKKRTFVFSSLLRCPICKTPFAYNAKKVYI